jgi:hypothetical protein
VLARGPAPRTSEASPPSTNAPDRRAAHGSSKAWNRTRFVVMYVAAWRVGRSGFLASLCGHHGVLVERVLEPRGLACQRTLKNDPLRFREN